MRNLNPVVYIKENFGVINKYIIAGFLSLVVEVTIFYLLINGLKL